MERQFEALLDEFRKLPPAVSRLPTLMEVAGYPHYENVCSNILFHMRCRLESTL
jgi:hypothetical protein